MIKYLLIIIGIILLVSFLVFAYQCTVELEEKGLKGILQELWYGTQNIKQKIQEHN